MENVFCQLAVFILMLTFWSVVSDLAGQPRQHRCFEIHASSEGNAEHIVDTRIQLSR